ncbi:hypothetical protein SAICODRAFT_9310 [Saitoella complicata NRRL Y-17804]|nr:uncharacterized protein SAICODRAFT_9310 [Saitoella complicata NRRL Y-17804]ODQ50981.1 hypothetical protein SAICODRAFT_9310 [Saitoella complicata NRRL Y-17804]
MHQSDLASLRPPSPKASFVKRFARSLGLRKKKSKTPVNDNFSTLARQASHSTLQQGQGHYDGHPPQSASSYARSGGALSVNGYGGPAISDLADDVSPVTRPLMSRPIARDEAYAPTPKVTRMRQESSGRSATPSGGAPYHHQQQQHMPYQQQQYAQHYSNLNEAIVPRAPALRAQPSQAGLANQRRGPPAPLDVAPHRQREASVDSRSLASARSGSLNGQQVEEMDWATYLKSYAEGKINVSKPVLSKHAPAEVNGFFPAPKPANDKARIAALHSYGIMPEEGDADVHVDESKFPRRPSEDDLRSLPSTSSTGAGGVKTAPSSIERFQRIVVSARRHFGTKMCLISLVDEKKQFFKCEVGLGAPSTGRDVAFCGHTILTNEPMVVLDTLNDWRLCNNPLVTGDPFIRFYCGAPIITPDGFAIGTVCIIDTKPRSEFPPADRRRLIEYARMAMDEIEFARAEREKKLRAEMESTLQSFRQGATTSLPESPTRMDNPNGGMGLNIPLKFGPKRLGKLSGMSAVATMEGEQERYREVDHGRFGEEEDGENYNGNGHENGNGVEETDGEIVETEVVVRKKPSNHALRQHQQNEDDFPLRLKYGRNDGTISDDVIRSVEYAGRRAAEAAARAVAEAEGGHLSEFEPDSQKTAILTDDKQFVQRDVVHGDGKVTTRTKGAVANPKVTLDGVRAMKAKQQQQQHQQQQQRGVPVLNEPASSISPHSSALLSAQGVPTPPESPAMSATTARRHRDGSFSSEATGTSSAVDPALALQQQQRAKQEAMAHARAGQNVTPASVPRQVAPAPQQQTLPPAQLAVQLIAQTLRLDFVYILRISPQRNQANTSGATSRGGRGGNNLIVDAAAGITTELLAEVGMPRPPPVFDGSLHLRALRSDGGLIYQNPDNDEGDNTDPAAFKVGILMPLWREGGTRTEQVLKSKTGAVLAGFTRKMRPTGLGFTADEVRYVREFGQTMKEVLAGPDM